MLAMILPLAMAAMQTPAADPVVTPPQQTGGPSYQVNDDMIDGVVPTGPTRVALLVGRKGRVEGCRVIESSGSAQLDALGCKVMSQLPFRPARTAAGKAVAAEVERRMNWPAPKR